MRFSPRPVSFRPGRIVFGEEPGQGLLLRGMERNEGGAAESGDQGSTTIRSTGCSCTRSSGRE